MKLTRELSGRLRVAKVNLDENPGLATRYGVQGIPAMLMVKNGQIIDRWTGALPEPGDPVIDGLIHWAGVCSG